MSETEEVVTTLPAPWITAQTQNLLKQRGHAWLLQGPSGLGQYELALALVRAWLCDASTEAGACNTCTSCHAIDVRSHTDFCILMPETVMIELGWPLGEKAQADIDDKKRKPSKEIRIDAMRDAVEFAQRTAGRGRGKAMLVYPAERMNHITANALLKTLEEPPGDLKFVLASEAAHQLLPTIRSRCLTHTLTWPQEFESLAWMTEQGVKKADAEPLLRAAGGRPADALNFANSGRNPSDWQSFPKAMAKGDVGFVSNWLPADLLDAQQKLCHDLMAAKSGAAPRFFKPSDLPTAMPSYTALAAWHKTLSATARTVEHPFNAGLMLEALVSGAQRVMMVTKT
ncbi:MAG: hypothetical protein RJB10_209 [Pseudomonadota bacterium]|jgi:DNA polymerase-3 subunit delta'